MTVILLDKNMTGSVSSDKPSDTLVIFDDRVSDIEILSQALLPGSLYFTINIADNGLATISQLLATTRAKYLAIVAHGEPGVVHLGKDPLDIQQLQLKSHLLQDWGVEEIALYSCEVAQGDIGKDLIYQLSELTGATVAAAATKIGSSAFGGNWNLSVTTGDVAAPRLFESAVLQNYQAVLAVKFGSPTTIPAGTNVNSINLQDLNGDGKLDIFTANRGSNDISVLIGDGAGGFGPVINYAVGTDPISAAVGDFNSDGKLDIFTANRGSSTISVLFGNGVGGFGPAITYAAEAGASGARVGDFNNDSKLDISTTNYGSNTVSILFGDGLGGFGTATNYPVGSTPYATVMGDFNGDGKLDFITAGSGTSSLLLSVLLNDGVGGFSAAANVAVGSNPNYLRSGDFNGDGKLDLAMTDNSDKISVLLGDGNGGFGAATKFAVASTPNGNGLKAIPQNLLIGDFNGDGKLDLVSGTIQRAYVLGSLSFSDTSLLLGDGNGSFSPAVVVGSGYIFNTAPSNNGLGGASNLVAGDINGDGKLDIVSANGTSNTVSVLLNTTNPTRNDFNSDQKSDILWRKDDGTVALWQMNGSTVTTGSYVTPTLDSTWKIASTADFSGDGKADLLWRNDNGTNALWTMNGSAIVGGGYIPTLDSTWKVASTADFDGDKKADLLWRKDDGTTALWKMNGATIVSGGYLPTLDSTWKVASTGDFDGDAKADLLWRNDDGTTALWKMNGSAVVSGSYLPTLDSTWKVASSADFNGDGKTDLLWRKNDGTTALWTMNGAAVVAGGYLPTLDSTWKVASSGDFNGDGKADLLWRNDNGTNALWEMNGATVLAGSYTPTLDSSWQVAAPIL
jgi:Domain of unknown function (DUF4347)/FG-GAP-like repeat